MDATQYPDEQFLQPTFLQRLYSSIFRSNRRRRGLYRGDGRHPTNLFINGMTATRADSSIFEHLSGGSGLVATTRSRLIASDFAIQAAIDEGFGAVYDIEACGEGRAIVYRKPFKHLKSEQEVVFTQVEPVWIGAATTHDHEQAWSNPIFEDCGSR